MLWLNIKKINEPTNNHEEKVIDDDKNDSTNKENQEVQKNTEDFKKVGKARAASSGSSKRFIQEFY